MAVALVVIEDVLPPTVEVKDVISAAKALSAFALVVCSVLIADVLLLTVEVKLEIALALAEVSVVKVTISP
jgi:hypothetical protein